MKKKHPQHISTYAQLYKITSNLVLSVLAISIGALCLSPVEQTAKTEGEESTIYRSAPNSEAISLMFNVYWGTDEVYRILDILSKHKVKATFFIGGSWADDNVDCLRDIDSAGHEIGNHGYFHKDHGKLNLQENQKEISDCNQFIRLAIGKKPILFAPPSGAYSNQMLSACKTLNMTTILWSKDTIDWRDKDCALIYTRATKNVRGGDFILMHPMKETADVLDDVLKYYEQNKLSVITVSENLQNNEKI